MTTPFRDTAIAFGPSETAGGTASDSLTKAKEWLLAVGWTIPASGDGSASYDDTGSDVSANFSTALSWCRLQSPDASWELTFQSITTNSFRAKYSKGGGFIGGTPSATQTPSAVDEIVWMGAGTDAAPTGSDWSGQNGTAYNGLIGCVEPVDPYRFWFVRYASDAGSAGIGFAWALWADYVSDAPDEDIDRRVVGMGRAGTWDYDSHDFESPSSVRRMRGWHDGVARYFNLEALESFGGSASGGWNYPNAITGEHDLVPMIYRHQVSTSPKYVKGFSTIFLCDLFKHSWPGPELGRMLTVNGRENSFVLSKDLALVWTGEQIVTPDRTFAHTPARIWTSTSFIETSGVVYRMRAFDSTLGVMVYWNASSVDSEGSSYSGPGPLVNIIVDRVLGD